jgi:cell division septation protein DedD
MDGRFCVLLSRALLSARKGAKLSASSRGPAAAVIALLCALGLTIGAAGAAAETTTYTATETVPVPPASDFAGSGGGDGWAVALSETAVYNVFHHQTTLQVACHLQSNAEPCFTPETITEGSNEFATSGQPGLYLDQHTDKLYVFATRTSDGTAGVVCIDTTLAPTNPDPFCGFTALTPVGHAPVVPFGISGASDPVLIGTHWYAFSFVNAKGQGEGQNELMCFDVSTDAACAGQPYAVPIGTGEVSDEGYPSPSIAAIDGQVIIPLNIDGTNRLACFDDATQSGCTGKWPVALTGVSYASDNGASFPLLDATGKTIGLCLPTGTDQCFNLEGEETATPAGMASVIAANTPWNGPALVLGPRVYVPNGNANDVQCFDYSTGASCTNFPKTFTDLGYLYTVNPDPQRPTCIWVNSDNGEHQIQDFDAYTGEACGEGTVRVLGSQFVVAQPQCTPASYVSIQVLKPARNTYSSGSVGFDDGDGNPIPGLAEEPLDETGTASLAGLALNTPTGLPQFLFTLNGETGKIGSVEVELTWLADYDASCIGEHTSATEPPPVSTPISVTTPTSPTTTTPTTTTTTPAPTPAPAPAPAPKSGVLAFGSAHLASNSARACVAGGDYLASVSGKDIASATFMLDGRKLKTLSKANSHGAFTLAVPVATGKVEHLSIHVVFTSASSNRSQTINKTLARCAAAPKHVTKPRFTG